jgi:AcrR family transcriptional regulator
MPRKPAKPADPGSRIVDAALALAARGGWHRASLAAIAAEAGLPLLEVYRCYRSKTAILDAFRRRVDEAVLAGSTGEGDGERPRDRLFDVLMHRFEALAPWKEGVRTLAREARGDPLGALLSGPGLVRSMAWMLEAAGVGDGSWRGAARAHLLAALYLAVMRVWLNDESADMMKTMAALDRRLRNAESWLGLVPESGPDTAMAAPKS